MLLFSIADRLHQPLSVVEDMGMDEISGWVAYFRIRDRESKT